MTASASLSFIPKSPKIPKSKLLTYEDYARITPPESGHYELHNGQIIYLPSPTPHHQDVCGSIYSEIRQFLKKTPLGRVYIAPLDTTFTTHDTFQPDVLYISNEKLQLISEKRILGAPDLVVEVLSEGNTNKEMSYKKHIFESTSVSEYWFINLQKQTLAQYENVEGEFLLRGVKTVNETIKSFVIEGFEMPIKEIFGL
jgi:Uma2 family endonuclease